MSAAFGSVESRTTRDVVTLSEAKGAMLEMVPFTAFRVTDRTRETVTDSRPAHRADRCVLDRDG